MPLGNLDYLLDVSTFLKEIALTVLYKESRPIDSTIKVMNSVSAYANGNISMNNTSGSMMVNNDWDKMSLNGEGGYFTEAEVLDSVSIGQTTDSSMNPPNSILSIETNKNKEELKKVDLDALKIEGNPDNGVTLKKFKNPLEAKEIINSLNLEKKQKSEIVHNISTAEPIILENVEGQCFKYLDSKIGFGMSNISKSSHQNFISELKINIENNKANVDCSLPKPPSQASACVGDGDTHSNSLEESIPSWINKTLERSEFNLTIGQNAKARSPQCACSEQTNISVHEVHKCVFISPVHQEALQKQSEGVLGPLNSLDSLDTETKLAKNGAGDSAKVNSCCQATQTSCHWPQYNFPLRESASGPDSPRKFDKLKTSNILDPTKPVHSFDVTETSKKGLINENSPATKKEKHPVKKSNDLVKTGGRTVVHKSKHKKQSAAGSKKYGRKKNAQPVSQENTEADETTLEYDDAKSTAEEVSSTSDLDTDLNDDKSEGKVDDDKDITLTSSGNTKRTRSLKTAIKKFKEPRKATEKENKEKLKRKQARNYVMEIQNKQEHKKSALNMAKPSPTKQLKPPQTKVRLWSPPSNSWATGGPNQTDHENDHSMDQPMSEIQRLLESLNHQLQAPPVSGGRKGHVGDNEVQTPEAASHSNASTGGRPLAHGGDTFWENPLKSSDARDISKLIHPGQNSKVRKIHTEPPTNKGVNPELEAVCKNMQTRTTPKNKTSPTKRLQTKPTHRTPVDLKKSTGLPSSINRRKVVVTKTPPVEEVTLSDAANRFPDLKHVRTFDLPRYDDMVKSHQSSSDRRLKSVAAKNGCKIAIDGPFRVFDQNATCVAMRSKVSYRCYVGSASKERLEKCINYLKETFPNTAVRCKV